MYNVRLKDGTQFTCKYYEYVSGIYYFYQTSRGVTITALYSEIDYIYKNNLTFSYSGTII